MAIYHVVPFLVKRVENPDVEYFQTRVVDDGQTIQTWHLADVLVYDSLDDGYEGTKDLAF